MERLDIREAFMTLKPLCDEMMRHPSIENARTVKTCIESISTGVVQDLMEYLLFPITVHLQNDLNSHDTRQHLVETMRAILQKARIKKIAHFHNMYSYLLYQIYDKSNPNLIISNHEELKEAVVLCLADLMQRSTTDVIESLYTKENTSKLGQGIFLCLSIAKVEKANSLRLAAIDAALKLSQVHDAADAQDIVLRAQVADVLMLVLPGVASRLLDIALGSDIQGHKVTMMAIRAWGRIISLVMEDMPKEDNIPSIDSLYHETFATSFNSINNGLKSRDPEDLKRILKTAERNQEWFNAAATKLNILVRVLTNLMQHSHCNVRKELVECVSLVLIKCSRNMKPCFPGLIEILISLSEDDNSQVSEEAKKALIQINTKYTQSSDLKPLVELIEENFYNLLTELPRIIRKSDDTGQLTHLNRLIGYLRLLGKNRLPKVMSSVGHLQRLLLALVYIAELDCSSVSLLEDPSTKDIHDTVQDYPQQPWKRFKFIHENRVGEKLTMACKLLCEFGDLEILVDNILSLVSDMPQYKKELILLLNSVIAAPGQAEKSSLYESIVTSYITNDLWYLPLAVSQNVTLNQAQSNVIQCCLLTEGLGILSQYFQSSPKPFLMKTLYFVIERAGSRCSALSLVGLHSLERIAKSFGYKDVADMLKDNVDHFSFYITVKLRKVEREPGVLDVVAAVVRFSTFDALPYLNEIVRDALSQSKANYQLRNVHSFLKVFHTFVLCMKQLVVPQVLESTDKEFTPRPDPAETTIRGLLEYQKAKRDSETFEDEDPEGKPEDMFKNLDHEADFRSDYDYAQEEKPKPPDYVTMIEEVADRCLHFLPSKDKDTSLLVMSTLRECILILADWEDRLLPLVHKLWHPLVARFQDSDPLMVARAWELLHTVVRTSKDFLKSRALTQVLPALSDFLDRSAKESYKKSRGTVYDFTRMYKLQRDLLSQLGLMARNMSLRENELWKLLTIVESYLDSHQHVKLQECCVGLYKDVADYNEDVVWVKCLEIWNRKVAKIPKDSTLSLEDLKSLDSSTQDEYRENVETILTYIEEKTTDM
ncbi:TELO2-interacting protein 1 homolog [Orussus abietinus]|uniref:TELO2-interacting protein 1 homolog n=1 Tax=Orussus abietinus TaxID=222816 RepID=UPI000625598E|nr:TELO2-interacting protein 1 homolog [Orussus abietinus]